MKHTDRGPEVHPTPATAPAGMAAHDTHRQQSNPGTAADRDGAESLKTELLNSIKDYERRTTDLLLFALALSELLELPTEKPRSDGGRPLKYINKVWEDAAEAIALVQTSAKYVATDMFHLLSELQFYIDNPNTPAF